MTNQLSQAAMELDTALQALFALVGHSPEEAKENAELFTKRAIVRGITPLIADHAESDVLLEKFQQVTAFEEIEELLTTYFEPEMIRQSMQQGIQEELKEYLDEVLPVMTPEQQTAIGKLFLHFYQK